VADPLSRCRNHLLASLVVGHQCGAVATWGTARAGAGVGLDTQPEGGNWSALPRGPSN
jgi:hypothetical protein